MPRYNHGKFVYYGSGVYKGKKRANVDDKKIPVGSRQGQPKI